MAVPDTRMENQSFSGKDQRCEPTLIRHIGTEHRSGQAPDKEAWTRQIWSLPWSSSHTIWQESAWPRASRLTWGELTWGGGGYGNWPRLGLAWTLLCGPRGELCRPVLPGGTPRHSRAHLWLSPQSREQSATWVIPKEPVLCEGSVQTTVQTLVYQSHLPKSRSYAGRSSGSFLSRNSVPGPFPGLGLSLPGSGTTRGLQFMLQLSSSALP